MSNWQPTMELRFVERYIRQAQNGHIYDVKQRILQQRWVRVDEQPMTIYVDEEWRDVPVESEDG